MCSERLRILSVKIETCTSGDPVSSGFVAYSLINSCLLAHRAIIDVLRLIGANNKYIARQFQRQAFFAAFKGGIIGIVLAIPVIYSLSWLTGYLGIPEVLKGVIGPHVFIILAFIPFVISFLSMVISRIAVFRTLVRME